MKSNKKCAKYTEVGSVFEDQLDSMMLAMFDLDETKFNIILDHQISAIGFEEAMNIVVYPLLDKLSIMWLAGSVKGVHENFVNNLIRRKTLIETEKISRCDCDATFRCLIFLPENESHELSLLFTTLYTLEKQSQSNQFGHGCLINRCIRRAKHL